MPDGTVVLDLAGHTDSVDAIAFRPHDAQLATAGFDATVRLRSLADGTPDGVKGTIVLEAAPGAASGSGTIRVMVHVSINFVIRTADCSGPINVRVER